MTRPELVAIVPAAGVGSRMRSDIPKQYLSLAGMTVLEHTLLRLLGHEQIGHVYVAVSPSDGWWRQCRFSNDPRISRVEGGAERSDSVHKALVAASQRYPDDTRVLVHDAARPCIRHEDISLLIEQVAASQHGGLLGMPVRDTMKRTASDDAICATVERENLWHAFTPQLFFLGGLRLALQQAHAAGRTVTDEASAMEMAGFRPLMVAGHADNLKITRPEDLPLAAYYLQCQSAKPE